MVARPPITAQNGAWPLASLVVIDRLGHRLQPSAAASLARMVQDGCPGGVVTTAYRDRAEQARLLALYGYPHAEYPGRSRHGDAWAVDFPEPARSWVRRYGYAYGWIFPVKAESWHGEYVESADQHRNRPAPAAPSVTPAAPPPPPPMSVPGEEDGMYYEALTGSANGLIKKGWWYSQVSNGPLVPLTNLEVEGAVRPLSVLTPPRVAKVSWYGDDLVLLAAVKGLAEAVPLPADAPLTSMNNAKTRLSGPGRLTGRVIFPGAPDRLGQWHYPGAEAMAA